LCARSISAESFDLVLVDDAGVGDAAGVVGDAVALGAVVGPGDADELDGMLSGTFGAPSIPARVMPLAITNTMTSGASVMILSRSMSRILTERFQGHAKDAQTNAV
jgi:hypothetical protein